MSFEHKQATQAYKHNTLNKCYIYKYTIAW